MRVVLICQAAFGEKVLEGLLENKEEVVGVFYPPDPPGKSSKIRRIAEEQSLPVFQPKKMRDPGVFEEYKALKPDLTVMAFVTDILPEYFLTYPRYHTIQFHPSLLPKHRGGSAIQWAIIHGDDKTGLSIFWPDAGIDTGPILLQKEIQIGPNDTTGSLYFEKIFPMGVDALVEAVKLVREGIAPSIPQDDNLSTYEPLCKLDNSRIDWKKSASDVYNLIRGCNPQPGAVTLFHNKILKIFDCRLETGSLHILPGEVGNIREDSFNVGCNYGSIKVLKVQLEGEQKENAGLFSASVGLKSGDSFDIPDIERLR